MTVLPKGKGKNIMPKGQRRDYTKEQKLMAVHLMKSKVMKPKEVFKLLDNVDRQTVYRWIKEYDANGEKAFDSKAVLPNKEIKRLQKELDDARITNEILKKAIAYFAKEEE